MKKSFRTYEKNVAGKRRLVWHVFHWKERYAVDPHNWPAERGLLFLRQVVAPIDTEATHYLGQLRDLETLAADDRRRHRAWKGLWDDLQALTATQSRITFSMSTSSLSRRPRSLPEGCRQWLRSVGSSLSISTTLGRGWSCLRASRQRPDRGSNHTRRKCLRRGGFPGNGR